PLENPIVHTVGFTILYVGFGSLLAMTVDLQLGQYGGFIISPLARIGAYSYSIYLWHYVVAHVLPSEGVSLFILYVALSLILGIVMAKLIECPILALRDRWLPTVSEKVGRGVRIYVQSEREIVNA